MIECGQRWEETMPVDLFDDLERSRRHPVFVRQSCVEPRILLLVVRHAPVGQRNTMIWLDGYIICYRHQLVAVSVSPLLTEGLSPTSGGNSRIRIESKETAFFLV